VQEDVALAASGNVLANDRDRDGAALSVAAPGSFIGVYGTLTLAVDGSYTYALHNDAQIVQSLHQGRSVTDSFGYVATDGLESDAATLTVIVAGTNDAPVAIDDTASANEDGVMLVRGNVVLNDTDVDTDTVLRVLAPGSYSGAYGTLSITANGGYTYALANGSLAVQSLAAGQTVSDIFNYVASDGFASDAGVLTVTVTGANDAPVTAADLAAVQEDGVLAAEGNVLLNDADVDAGAALTVANAGSHAGAECRRQLPL
jgi:VCBS repeat-containing protein